MHLKGENKNANSNSSIYCSKSLNKDIHNAQYKMIKQIWDWIITKWQLNTQNETIIGKKELEWKSQRNKWDKWRSKVR